MKRVVLLLLTMAAQSIHGAAAPAKSKTINTPKPYVIQEPVGSPRYRYKLEPITLSKDQSYVFVDDKYFIELRHTPGQINGELRLCDLVAEHEEGGDPYYRWEPFARALILAWRQFDSVTICKDEDEATYFILIFDKLLVRGENA